MCQGKNMRIAPYATSTQSEVAGPMDTVSDSAIKQEDNSQNDYALVKG